MLNKKFFPAAILSLAVIFTACSAGGTEVSEAVSETVSETAAVAAETTTTASEATTETTTEVTTEAVDTSGVEYIKEALQAEWNDPFGINLCVADLNGDGVKELFKTDNFAAGWYGLTYVYDVSDGAKKLCTAGIRIWQDTNAGIYSDENGGLHLIVKEQYPGCSHQSDTAYFDITYDSVKMPLFTRIVKWENECENSIYTGCEVIPSFYDEEHLSWRNFDPQSCEYAEKHDGSEYTDENGKMEELIENTVYGGLTYVSEIEEIYMGSYKDFKDFEEFWQQAAPKLAEVYGN